MGKTVKLFKDREGSDCDLKGMDLHVKPLKHTMTLPVLTSLLLCCRNDSVLPWMSILVSNKKPCRKVQMWHFAQASFAVAEDWEWEPNCRNSGFPVAWWLNQSHSSPQHWFWFTGPKHSQLSNKVVWWCCSFQVKSIIFSNLNLLRPEKIKSQIHIIRGLCWLVDKAQAVLQEQIH